MGASCRRVRSPPRRPSSRPSSRLNALREAARLAPRPDAIPEILNLPRALAFRRYQEFARYVHPELQEQLAQVP